MSSFITKLCINLIKLYKLTISPFLKLNFGGGCRFTPTCSDYTIEALEKHGLLKGMTLGIKRFSKCHPFGEWGHDPVPLK